MNKNELICKLKSTAKEAFMVLPIGHKVSITICGGSSFFIKSNNGY